MKTNPSRSGVAAIAALLLLMGACGGERRGRSDQTNGERPAAVLNPFPSDRGPVPIIRPAGAGQALTLNEPLPPPAALLRRGVSGGGRTRTSTG